LENEVSAFTDSRVWFPPPDEESELSSGANRAISFVEQASPNGPM